jgi:hypothetical protein
MDHYLLWITSKRILGFLTDVFAVHVGQSRVGYLQTRDAQRAALGAEISPELVLPSEGKHLPDVYDDNGLLHQRRGLGLPIHSETRTFKRRVHNRAKKS